MVRHLSKEYGQRFVIILTIFLSRSHENLLRYISYRAVLPFTQRQVVPLGNTPSPDTPRYRLDCPSHRQHQKRKTLALYFPMANFLSRLHENLLRYISYRAVLPFTQLQEVPLGSTPSPDAPLYRLDCPSRGRRQKRKTLALFVAALIICRALSLFVIACRPAHVHRPTLTLPSLVDC